MLRKLQQRSTFSCSDRTRKEQERGTRANKDGSRAPTDQRKRCWSSSGFRTTCVCVCVRPHTERPPSELKVHILVILSSLTWLSSRTLTHFVLDKRQSRVLCFRTFFKGSLVLNPPGVLGQTFCPCVLGSSGLCG